MVSFQVMADSQATDYLSGLVNPGRGGRLLNVQEYHTETAEKKDGNILLLIDSWKHKLV